MQLIGKLISTHAEKDDKGRTLRIPDGIWLLPETTLSRGQQAKVFTQIPDAASISQALNARDLLMQDKDDHHLMSVRRINGVSHRGWLIKWSAFKFDREVVAG